jgi:hypothetical protein
MIPPPGKLPTDNGYSRKQNAQSRSKAQAAELEAEPIPRRAMNIVRPVETGSAVVLPFGTEPGTHAWLDAECWAWRYRARHADIVKALANIGIQTPVDKMGA